MRNSKSSPEKKSGRELAGIAKAMVKESNKKVPVKTIDCTPDWTGLVPLFIEWIQNGNSAQHLQASESIMQMARISDAYRKNQALFVASADMYEQLKKMIEVFEPFAKEAQYVSGLFMAKQAITKAEGKQ